MLPGHYVPKFCGPLFLSSRVLVSSVPKFPSSSVLYSQGPKFLSSRVLCSQSPTFLSSVPKALSSQVLGPMFPNP